MHRDSSIDERFVSHIWDSGYFAKDALRAKDGRRLEVVYHGQRNDDTGADFHNAEIRLDGQIHKGDVEVHVKNSHWRAHRHHANPIYNNTILHVAMWDDCIGLLTRKQNGERIPTLVLGDHLDDPIGKLWKTMEYGKETSNLCRKKAEATTLGAIGAALDRAGMDRFLQRAQVFQERLEQSDADQILYEGIMEALGYSKNKGQFLELAQKAPLKILEGASPEKIQAILFGVAGLLPSQSGKKVKFDAETDEYVNRIEKLWQPILSEFRGVQMFGEQWEFKIRPENFPTKRIAGISYILSKHSCEDGEANASLLTMFRSAFSGGKATQKLHDMLVLHTSGYWTRRYIFGGKQHKETPSLIGQSRAADIVINVILPVILAHAHQLGCGELEQAVTTAYASYRRLQDNNVTTYVSSQIFPDKKDRRSVINCAMRQQGLIHLYKNFCFVRNCQDCLLTEKNI
ncbi:DUF2851 family protein [Candidatus Poribacteria bacterium]